MSRIEKTFSGLREQGRPALVSYIMAGDPDEKTTLDILKVLPAAGADIIELGMPFSDPMADGPTIQAAAKRALDAGASMKTTLDLVRGFREEDPDTPIVLMGYYNPIYHYGVEKFLGDAVGAGVDGLLIVDLPPEEDAELCLPAKEAGLDFIRLITPTTDEDRLKTILNHASGFLYYVSIAGITGTASAASDAVEAAVKNLKDKSDLPVAVGFGIKTPEDVKNTASFADAVVVGSAIIQQIEQSTSPADDVTGFVTKLAEAVK